MVVGNQKVISIATGWGGEGTYVVTQGSVPTDASCGTQNTFALENTAPQRQEIIAYLLSAMNTGSWIDFYVDGCFGGSTRLKAVTLRSP